MMTSVGAWLRFLGRPRPLGYAFFGFIAVDLEANMYLVPVLKPSALRTCKTWSKIGRRGYNARIQKRSPREFRFRKAGVPGGRLGLR